MEIEIKLTKTVNLTEHLDTVERKSTKTPKRKRVSSSFAANLKAILAERGVSLQAAATICCVNKAVIHAWINGAQAHDPGAVLKLCQALKCDFQWLLTGTHTETRLKEMSLGEIFDIESDPAFSGIFMLEAKRLKRKAE